jgi:hypothetical protein
VARELVTRRSLARDIAVNAATKPVNIAVPAAVAVAALVLGAAWLVAVGIAAYVAMVAVTLFDVDEAAAVGRRAYERAGARHRPALERGRFAPKIAQRLREAQDEEARIRAAAADSSLPFPGLVAEVSRLVRELDGLAEQAQRLSIYLDAEDGDTARERLRVLRREPDADVDVVAALEAKVGVQEELRRRLAASEAEIEQIVVSLGTIHAQVVRTSVTAETAARESLAERVRTLGDEVTAIADAIGETSRRLDA